MFAKVVLGNLEVEKEEDGRWIAAITGLPGALAYGETEVEAISKVFALVAEIVKERYV
jgi:predicted RNase H-like HicB family nuclease